MIYFWKRTTLDDFFKAVQGFHKKYALEYNRCDFEDNSRNEERRRDLKNLSKMFKTLVKRKIKTTSENHSKLQETASTLRSYATTEDVNLGGPSGAYDRGIFSMKGARVIVAH